METGQDLNLRLASVFGRPVHALTFCATRLFEYMMMKA